MRGLSIHIIINNFQNKVFVRKICFDNRLMSFQVILIKIEYTATNRLFNNIWDHIYFSNCFYLYSLSDTVILFLVTIFQQIKYNSIKIDFLFI